MLVIRGLSFGTSICMSVHCGISPRLLLLIRDLALWLTRFTPRSRWGSLSMLVLPLLLSSPRNSATSPPTRISRLLLLLVLLSWLALFRSRLLPLPLLISLPLVAVVLAHVARFCVLLLAPILLLLVLLLVVASLGAGYVA